ARRLFTHGVFARSGAGPAAGRGAEPRGARILGRSPRDRALTKSAFFSLTPRMQQAIVSRLGWRSLRPVQEASIPPLLAGDDAIVLAPTAGGKTESAMIPLLDRLLAGS